MNSTFVAGSVDSISERMSAMMSSMSRLRSFFSFTVKSPLFASVTAASPSCMPVRREVFQNESTFVHGGEKVRSEKAVTQNGKSDHQDRACGQDPGPLQNGLHRATIKFHDASEKTGEVRFLRGEESGHVRTGGVRRSSSGFFAAYEVLAQCRCPSQSQKERSKQRNSHGDGEGAEEGPGHAGNGNQRKKNDNRSNGRSDEGNGQFPESALNGLEAALPG